MRLRLATGNAHKLREIREILEPIEVRGTDGIVGYEVVEDGSTFEANALKKAQKLLELTGEASLADDSGIEVDALNGAPGVYSARYAGVEGADADEANLQKLLVELADTPDPARTARYVCAIAYCVPGEAPRFFRGTLEGRIIHEKRGLGGFGYDPIFLLPDRGVTVAEIGADEKHAISHRGKAVRALREALRR
ncbi:MAG: RdgB/HAM1 family non-canonical purine NTP pyrophosphatase [Myxococcota bacterium]